MIHDNVSWFDSASYSYVRRLVYDRTVQPLNQRKLWNVLLNNNQNKGAILTSMWDHLPTGKQLHLTRRLVDIAVATTDRPIEWCKVAGDWTVFPVRGDVVAWTQVWQFDTDSTDLDSEHAFVEICAAVGATYRILIAGATMLALATGRP